MTGFEFQQLKLLLLDGTGLGKDAMHVHIGLALFVATRLAWRWRGGWLTAWLVALAAALTGEWLDAREELRVGLPMPDEAHWHDIWNTMLWPTLLLLVGRWLEPRAGPVAAAPPAPSGDDAEHAFE
jgi:hypothetical protein